MTLLEVDKITKAFGRRRQYGALEDVSLELGSGEVVGIVGESGSGKSTLARIVCGLLSPDAGTVTVDGTEVRGRVSKALWRTVQLVPQDSHGSLNPAMTVRQIIAEPAHFLRGMRWADAHRTAEDLLDHVGLDPALSSRRPTQLSGGQRQRVAIARALAAEPRLLVCDESTSALDVSVQAQILCLLQQLQSQHGFGLLFITHDISVVRYLADRILVMRHGEVVEQLDGASLTPELAAHGYTRQLLDAVPTLTGIGAK